jgi:hypothetical protein
MIERLVLALRALARAPDADAQREVAHDFDDAYLVFSQCQQLEVTAAQSDALVAVEQLLHRMPEASNPDEPPQRIAYSATLREAAQAALRELGYADVASERGRP